ncbi:LOW QUALITY PROTEIN: C-C motif chemokine 25-like [Boleophthalmus pectinirostris]|uniref:LOW QUALITY PROTEIN: C-C motif chemokine 25-like n=1 Tax=Boleophthalmus pectinirostris TaxID=150288 RepID=UPI00242EA727|nr:LOW QUALITY PROTEIN: C-C motif chemokine 25-like [Boleophthalmus pectinirostris]
MRWITVLSLLVVCFVCLSVAQVSFDDCCLKYAKRHSRLIQKHAVKYRRQEMDGDCNIRAVIFTLKKGRVYCTNPDEKWVVRLMETIDKRSQNTKRKRPYKG